MLTVSNNASTCSSASPERLHHRDPLQGVRADVEDDAVPVGRDHGVGPAREALAPEIGPRGAGGLGGGGHDVGLVDEALDLPGPHEALVQRPVGAHVVVLEIEERELRVAPLEAVTIDVGLEQIELRDPVELTVERVGFALEVAEHCFPAREDHVADVVAAAADRGPVSSAYFCARRRYSHCSSTAVERLPSASSTVALHVGSCDTTRIAGTGPEIEKSLRAPAPPPVSKKLSSTIASTIAVVPTLRKVATSQRLASPAMTWRRR